MTVYQYNLLSGSLKAAPGEINFLLTSRANVSFVKFVGENLLFFPAFGTFTYKGFQIFKLLESGTMCRCFHSDRLPFLSASGGMIQSFYLPPHTLCAANPSQGFGIFLKVAVPQGQDLCMSIRLQIVANTQSLPLKMHSRPMECIRSGKIRRAYKMTSFLPL